MTTARQSSGWGEFNIERSWESCMTISAHNHWAWGGEPLPETKWNAIKTDLEANFADQKDSIAFTPALSGKTDFKIVRDGQEIGSVNALVLKLNDPDPDLQTKELN